MAVSPIGAMMSAATAAPVTGTQQLGAAGIPTDTGQAGAAGGSDFGNVVTNALQGMQDSQDGANNLAVVDRASQSYQQAIQINGK